MIRFQHIDNAVTSGWDKSTTDAFMRKRYEIKVGCCNCHHESMMLLDKGTRIDSVECGFCGCKTLISKENM